MSKITTDPTKIAVVVESLSEDQRLQIMRMIHAAAPVLKLLAKGVLGVLTPEQKALMMEDSDEV